MPLRRSWGNGGAALLQICRAYGAGRGAFYFLDWSNEEIEIKTTALIFPFSFQTKITFTDFPRRLNPKIAS
jgi:hypothetical protein